jgi:hypothetical protein
MIDHSDLLMIANRAVVACSTKVWSGGYTNRNSLIPGCEMGESMEQDNVLVLF